MVKIPQMSDPKIDDYQILKYLQGKSSPTEKENILAWLAISEENRNTYFQLKALWHAYKDNFENDQLNLEQSLKAYRDRIKPVKKSSLLSVALTRLFSFRYFSN